MKLEDITARDLAIEVECAKHERVARAEGDPFFAKLASGASRSYGPKVESIHAAEQHLDAIKRLLEKK